MRNSPDFSESIENNETPKTVLDYLESMNATILNDYRTPDGQYSEHCGLIAIDLAKLFIAFGKEPYIMKVSEYIHKNGSIHSKSLNPLVYEDRVSWGAHQVCCCGDEAFDPIVGKPISINQYTQTVFGESINMEILIPKNLIREFVSR